jgi:hypothetical protein
MSGMINRSQNSGFKTQMKAVGITSFRLLKSCVLTPVVMIHR